MMNEPLRMDAANPWQPHVQQYIFRQLMHAVAYPGRALALPGDALPGVLATVVDAEVSLADVGGLITADDGRRLQARRAAPELARFVVARGESAPTFEPALGSLECPEQGATVIVRVKTLGQGATLRLRGPGIDGTTTLAVTGLDPDWIIRRTVWNASFPLGVDLILVDADQVAALPRTTLIAGET